jgi:hypothetical protein
MKAKIIIWKIGIGIILLAFILTIMSPYVLLFTIPAFFLGVVLIWISNRNIRFKILWTTLPIILVYPACLIFMYLYSSYGMATAQKFDFIFPNQFKGAVIIVGNISCGQTIQIKEGREQLFIPSNGIFLYQGEIQTGYVNHKYYYKLDSNKLKKLPERANYMYFEGEKNPPQKHIIGVWLGGTGSKTSHEFEPPIEYESMTLNVDSKDSIDLHYNFQKNKEFESLTDSLIRDCEKKKIQKRKE